MQNEKRKIPYGVINWATLMRECYFVDNTAFIRELERCKTPVYLRPKRFGKSIICSMLAHYYDIALKERFDELFGKTEIGRKPTPLRNANALAKVQAYVARGEGEEADLGDLAAKFGRAKFFSDAFFPYALYYLGLLTFVDDYTLNLPNLTIKNMFVEVCGNRGYNWFDLP